MTTMKITEYDVSSVFANPHNVRDNLGAPEGVDELADSIRRYGLMQPIVVTSHPTREGDFMLIAGHRRLAAAKKAGLLTIPGIFTDQFEGDGEQIAAMLTENLHREQITAVEEARAVQAMLDLPGFTVEKVATAIAKSPSTVRRRAQLLGAGERVLDAVKEKKIDLFQAEEIAKYAAEPELAEKLTEAAESGSDWNWQSAQKQAESVLEWKTLGPQVYDHLVKLGYDFLEAEEAKGSAFNRRYPSYELPGLSDQAKELLELTSRVIPKDVLDEHGKDGLRPYLNNSSRTVEWYTPAPVKEEAKKPELTPEEIAEQEAREKVKLALRVEHPKFKEHLENLAGQPGKLKGTAHGALVEVICNFGYELPDMLTVLGIDFDPNEPNKGDVYRDAVAAKSLDQLAYALFIVDVIGIGNRGTNEIYDLSHHNPSGHGKYTNRKLNALETIYGIEPSDAIKQARAYWEPALPGTEAEAPVPAIDDEVDF
ncbi:ParB/RepB/Spo0J family partition protein [Rothia nasimurium]|uniref:ParB/RepB/Spo0J family partition protein n=1 Tax=Rothia nasimurium TaxID=85336 RepID=UPI001F00A08D|nr:ParB/RepB/Spo0J family partition protein [Rothia nasimurium]